MIKQERSDLCIDDVFHAKESGFDSHLQILDEILEKLYFGIPVGAHRIHTHIELSGGNPVSRAAQQRKRSQMCIVKYQLYQ